MPQRIDGGSILAFVSRDITVHVHFLYVSISPYLDIPKVSNTLRVGVGGPQIFRGPGHLRWAMYGHGHRPLRLHLPHVVTCEDHDGRVVQVLCRDLPVSTHEACVDSTILHFRFAQRPIPHRYVINSPTVRSYKRPRSMAFVGSQSSSRCRWIWRHRVRLGRLL
jgi:hypothetical protein